MKVRTFIKLLKENFHARLQQKTGWGKNEVWEEFLAAIAVALVDMIDSGEEDAD